MWGVGEELQCLVATAGFQYIGVVGQWFSFSQGFSFSWKQEVVEVAKRPRESCFQGQGNIRDRQVELGTREISKPFAQNDILFWIRLEDASTNVVEAPHSSLHICFQQSVMQSM